MCGVVLCYACHPLNCQSMGHHLINPRHPGPYQQVFTWYCGFSLKGANCSDDLVYWKLMMNFGGMVELYTVDVFNLRTQLHNREGELKSLVDFHCPKCGSITR